MTIVGVDHVQLAMPAGREAEARAFYGGVLGIPEITKPPALAARGGAWFESGRLKLHLGVDRDFRPAQKAHAALVVNDLKALIGTLRRAGHDIIEDDSRDGPFRVFVNDPFGNRLELMEPLAPHELEHLWAEHLKGEFETKDVEATLATMVDDAYVNHMPVNTGGRGKEALRRFYRDDFIPSWPDDLETTPINRVVGDGQLVDELRSTFTHERPMNWLLPGVPPTGKKIVSDIVVVVQFRGDKLACERIYWDHASVLRQVGLLNE
jgi:carboxymethylenebutenolidase